MAAVGVGEDENPFHRGRHGVGTSGNVSYVDKEGNVIHDGAETTIKMLAENPGLSFELITNSVLTSDNFYTQSVIDMDAVPRLLLSEDFQKTWLESREASELNPEFIDSDE